MIKILIFIILLIIPFQNAMSKGLLITDAKLVMDPEIFKQRLELSDSVATNYSQNIHENISIFQFQNDTDLMIEPMVIYFKDRTNEYINQYLSGYIHDTISANGNFVTTGIFAPFSNLGLSDIGGEDLTNDIRSPGSITSINELASDSFNPKSVFIANNRRHGITHALVSPSAAGNSIFAGTGAVVDLTGNFNSIIREKAFIYVQLGESGTIYSGGSRAASLLQLKEGLESAQCRREFCQNSLILKVNNIDNKSVLSDSDTQSLVPVLRGKIPLIISVDRAVDILNVLKLKDKFNSLDLILLGASEAWKVADKIASANVKVMIDPHINLPSSFDTVDSSEKNIIILDDAGVDYAITNISAAGTQGLGTLTQHAGNAVGNGLTWAKAFDAITTTPARWFNIPLIDTSIIIWDGDPLNITSAPTNMYINLQEQSLQSRQTLLRDRYNPNKKSDEPHKYR